MNKIFNLYAVATLACAYQQLHSMEQEFINEYNSYNGIPITQETLLRLAPGMPENVKENVQTFFENSENLDLVKELASRPDPFTKETRLAKRPRNKELIESAQNVTNLGSMNYALKPNEQDAETKFVIKINNFNNKMAYLLYALGKKTQNPRLNLFHPEFTREESLGVDHSQLSSLPSFQHLSAVAGYLTLSQAKNIRNYTYLKTAPTYPFHIPGTAETVTDENYCIVQEYVPGFQTNKDMSLEQQEAFWSAMPETVLEEMFDGIKSAALWDIATNLGLAEDGRYYVLDLKERYDHYPPTFYYQGQEGHEKYVYAIVDGIERVAQRLSMKPEQYIKLDKEHVKEHIEFMEASEQAMKKPHFEKQFNFWKSCISNDKELLEVCRKYEPELPLTRRKNNLVPYFVEE